MQFYKIWVHSSYVDAGWQNTSVLKILMSTILDMRTVLVNRVFWHTVFSNNNTNHMFFSALFYSYVRMCLCIYTCLRIFHVYEKCYLISFVWCAQHTYFVKLMKNGFWFVKISTRHYSLWNKYYETYHGNHCLQYILEHIGI